jgi:hypothetical protein
MSNCVSRFAHADSTGFLAFRRVVSMSNHRTTLFPFLPPFRSPAYQCPIACPDSRILIPPVSSLSEGWTVLGLPESDHALTVEQKMTAISRISSRAYYFDFAFVTLKTPIALITLFPFSPAQK